MSARVVEAVVVRDDEAGVELRVMAQREGGGVLLEVRIDGEEPRTIELSAAVAKELQLGILRLAKASGEAVQS